ncbi:pseudouridine-metabolizing bifunctional protein C1861.05-like isoform X1 [Podarcis lilfordi]|uniref:Pseudouridine-metabolizing bifunctional protein C1861.05-like isoform X1 n=1 Tax=Podarcis lilfordi TaxID=74358 RepID=A0AA35KXV4_9SAUR|nr:pseudouridine-metabolizing bifunctional protein C1861.05-like isoform X1 [Podarcis lilfordi]
MAGMQDSWSQDQSVAIPNRLIFLQRWSYGKFSQHMVETRSARRDPLFDSVGRVASVACRVLQIRRYLNSSDFCIHPLVREALDSRRPVVALESTIITHGMPYPQNLSMAREVEEIIRANGSVPATIGVLSGRIHVGLQNEQLETLAKGKNAIKVSRRDLPYVLSQGLSGGTTVAGTMIVAHKAKIPVFVTGGIGGVHRGGEKTLDVSADLTELGRTPVAVISAGVKSILYIGRTLEYLETQGVCVATFGDSREFPAFFCHQSGFQAPYHVQNEEDAAQLIARSLNLQLGSGVLIAVPCPEDQAASGQLIEEAIQQALREAREKGITGKELTPFLLQKLNKLSSGESLRSNIALIKNNAKVGSCIAVALNKIQRAQGWGDDMAQNENVSPVPKPVVIGGINVDFIAKARDATIVGGGQTNPSIVRQSFGGVGRNLADCLSRLGKTPFFISVMGKDEHSESVLRYCKHMDMRGVLQLEGHNTATYCSVFTGSGELSLGLGDMDIHQQITEQYVSTFKETLCSAPLVCIDGNVPVSTIQYVCQIAREHHLAVCYEPTDVDKASKPFLSESWRALACISPNLRELRAINRTLGHPVSADMPSTLEEAVKTSLTLARPLLGELHCVVVTLGQHGVLVCSRNMNGRLSLRPGTFNKATAADELCAVHYPAIPVPTEEIVNVSGAGDSLMAGILAGLLAGEDMDDCVRMGLLSASFSLRSYEPVSPDINATSVNVARLKAQQWPVAKRWKLT